MSHSLLLDERTIGDLFCRVVDTQSSVDKPERIVVLCHGFGAPGDDLVPCSRELYNAASDQLDSTRFVFPAAPLELEGGFGDSRAWWPIDMEALQQAMMSGDLRDLRNDAPELLSVRRQSLIQLIDVLKSETGLEEQQFVLGGFSQGSMLATDVALHMKHPPGGLVVWSGTLLNESSWKALAHDREDHQKFAVFQSHGRTDPILPFAGAEWLQAMLESAGFSVEFLPFSGQHTIPMHGIEGAAQLIAAVETKN